MRKVSLLLALVTAGLSTFAQYNREIIKTENASCVKTRMEVPKHHTIRNEVKAPGDILWTEDFSGGVPAGWTISDNGVGGFEFNNGDTAYTGAWVTAESAMINSLTHANGYMHLPADYYNCKPGWPREMVDNPLDIDATMETNAIDVSGPEFANGVILKFDAWWRLCCNEVDTKLEISVAWKAGDWHTFNGREVNSSIVSINDYPVGNNVVTPEYNISALIDSARGTNGGDTIRIQFRMLGGSHYFWSIDDIRMMEPYDNEVAINDIYAGLGGIFTLSEKYAGGEDGVANDYNTNYSEVPANVQNFLQLGAYLHQSGLNGVNTHVEFAIDSAGTGNIWTGISASSTGADAIIADYNPLTGDTIMYSDTTSGFDNAPFFYNPELDKAWFETNSYLEDGIPYTITYEAKSDNNSDEYITENNFDTLPISETYGRYSYHYQPNDNPGYSSTEGIFNYVHQDGSAYQGTDGVDFYGNIFSLYHAEGEDLKIWGTRFFLPPASNYVTFDASGNGLTIVPAIFWWDPQGGASGTGGFVEMEDVSIEGGQPYTVQDYKTNSWVYLNFDSTEVATADFPQGDYLVGFRVLAYNGQRISMGVDNTHRQSKSHFRIRVGDATDATTFYTWRPSGSAMIDAYTRREQLVQEQVGVKEVNKQTITKVSIYPNPTTGIVKVRNAENASIKVYSITGNLVKTTESHSVMTTINLSDLAKGTYLVKVINENEVVTKKITLLK